MKHKFQYIMVGSLITMLVIAGAFTLLFRSTSADATTPLPVQDAPVASLPSAEVSKPETTVFINEPEEITSQSENLIREANTSQVGLLGTDNNPQTDIDEITKYVTELVTKQERAILGKPGWLHIQDEIFYPVEFRGNGEPAPGMSVADLYPHDVTISEEWYLVDEQGYYQQRVGHIQTTEGHILQRTVTSDGELVNLTIQEANPSYEKSELQFVQEKVNLDHNLLYMLQMAKQHETEVSAWHEDDRYIVTFTGWYEEPDKFMNFETIIFGFQDKYVLDQNSGFFLSSEHLLNDGENWFVLEKITNLNSEIIEKLPEEAAQSLAVVREQ